MGDGGSREAAGCTGPVPEGQSVSEQEMTRGCSCAKKQTPPSQIPAKDRAKDKDLDFRVRQRNIPGSKEIASRTAGDISRESCHRKQGRRSLLPWRLESQDGRVDTCLLPGPHSNYT